MFSRSALLSVSDKTGIVDFAKLLTTAGYRIVSTGGTLKELQKAKIDAVSVEDVTGFPECFGGRVKTMHPMIMGGVLFNREMSDDLAEAKKLKIEPIDLVVVNLYPFAETVKKMGLKPDASGLPQEAIEQIDIGGPTLLRSAAKNHAAVTVVCDPADYAAVGSEIQKNGDTSLDLRKRLAAKVFAVTAEYDALIAEYMSGGETVGLFLKNGTQLRYGENPHQWGKYYRLGDATPSWTQLQGKEMSYLNILDADGAQRMVNDFSEPTAVFVKHANPSGIASALTIEDAFQAAYDTDRVSAFGVIIALNRPCTAKLVQKIIDQKIFTEIVQAPSFDSEALEILKQKPNLRVLLLKSADVTRDQSKAPTTYRSALDGMLVQDDDVREILEKDLTCVTKKKPTKEQIRDLLFAWKVVKHAKSNAIVLVKDSVTVGIGCGQTSRVDSSWIAAKRAGERAKGSVLASDAFFPFPDALEEAAKHGITAVIQPGGSIRDAEVFAKADELGLAMVTTGVRAFRH